MIVSTGRSLALVLVGLLGMVTLRSFQAALRAEAPPWVEQYREPAARLIGEATSDTFAWRRLSMLTDTIGHRLSGTPQLDRAIQWALAEMKRLGATMVDPVDFHGAIAEIMTAYEPSFFAQVVGSALAALAGPARSGLLRAGRALPAHGGSLGELIAAGVRGCMARPAGFGEAPQVRR